ncbi:hypothetical protein RIF25_08745 [Thermosynechococcaceae cyanobacterium BACA0444]|uniref:Uncharacterized protein n=1 Tax=Pseudocalidococcus azoricus BACA0444 TaxID=2918990 RepID=A0AAE4FTX1_9CYAN|nr:hypothetical protein [Pseudocalidococcus azoricus]MDS3860901.1 hypothetical protein [Pseudocalidococcus azoricus BACA0444]
MSNTTTRDASQRIKKLFQLGEQRARAAGHQGIVTMNDSLSEDKQKQLSAALRSLPMEFFPKLPQARV